VSDLRPRTTLSTLLSIDAQTYHADQVADVPTLSASLAVTLVSRSPAHAFIQHPRLNPNYVTPEPKKAWDVGTVAHSLLLEGYGNVHVVEGFDNWKRVAGLTAPTELAAQARAEGKIPLLRHEWDEVSVMVDAAREQLAGFDPAPLTDGKPEQTLTWDENGVACRCRPDWLADDFAVCEDVKTTAESAQPNYFSRKTIYTYGYDLRAAMYLRGIKAVTGVDAKWRWLVVEKKPPYAVSVVEPGEDVLAVGNAKLDRALEMWADCLATGLWPAYGREVHVAEAPPWELRWLDNSDEFADAAWSSF
jgi:PDDEXK-like domain of unknown function (DUF3799)